jgi:large subunit ribosomal protein L25
LSPLPSFDESHELHYNDLLKSGTKSLRFARESIRSMEEIALRAEPRKVIGKQVRQLRREGLIPVTLYGRRVEPESLQVPTRDLDSVLAQAGMNRLVDLKVEGNNQIRKVLIREIQRDVVSRQLLHADLYAVIMDEKITTELPVVLVNESPAVKDGMGILVQELTVLNVQCLPGDLIPQVEVDLANLASVHDSFSISDLNLGEAIELLDGAEEVIARIVPFAAEEVEEVAEEVGAVVLEGEEAEAGAAPEAEPEGEEPGS